MRLEYISCASSLTSIVRKNCAFYCKITSLFLVTSHAKSAVVLNQSTFIFPSKCFGPGYFPAKYGHCKSIGVTLAWMSVLAVLLRLC